MSFDQNLNEISLGTVFSLDYIQDLKKRLEIKEGQQLLIIQNNKQLCIKCSNDSLDKCAFGYQFTKKIDVQSREIGLQLKKIVTEHSLQCKVNNEYNSFDRNSILVYNQKQLIANVMLARFNIYGPQNPKKLLDVISQTLGYGEIFIYKGLKNPQLKRKMKKKFDNVVAQIRRILKLPASLVKNKKSAKTSSRKKNKFKFSFKESQSLDEEEDIHEPVFESEESLDEQSQFQAQVCLDLTQRKQRPSRQGMFAQKDMVKQQSNSPQFIENEKNTANIFENSIQKTKIIKKY